MFSVVQSIYKKNDLDNSGTMSTPEMRVAFKDAGAFVLGCRQAGFTILSRACVAECSCDQLLLIISCFNVAWF